MRNKLTFKQYMLAIITMMVFSAQGQVFQKVGNGLSRTGNLYTEAMYSHQGNIYASYFTYTYPGQTHTTTGYIEKWDGLAWHQYPPLAGKQISDLVIFQNELYVAAYDFANGLYNGKVYRLDGSNWVDVFPQLTGEARELEVHNGQLLVAGGFNENSSGEHNFIGYSTAKYR